MPVSTSIGCARCARTSLDPMRCRINGTGDAVVMCLGCVADTRAIGVPVVVLAPVIPPRR